jgi:uncharacterized phage protein (TIGR02218 family)
MSLPILEASRADGKPIELWRFAVERQIIASTGETTEFDETFPYADQPAAEAAGWFQYATDPACGVTWSPDGLLFTVTGIMTGAATWRRNIVALPSNAEVAIEFTASAVGHWFEPVTATVFSGSNQAHASINPPFPPASPIVTMRSGFIPVTASGEATIALSMPGSYPFIGHDDTYLITRVRLIIRLTDEEEEPPIEELFYGMMERSFTFLGDEYLPANFTRTPFRSGDGEGQEKVELRMPRSHAVAQLFHEGTPIAPVSATVYHVHRPDVAAGDSYYTPFVGQVENARFEGADCILTIESLRALLDLKTPMMLIQSKCANFVYDLRCGLSRESFVFETTVSAIDGFNVTLDGLATESGTDIWKFQNGFAVGPTGEHLFIVTQDGDVCETLAPPQHLNVGDNIRVYWGCDRHTTTCHLRFGNIQNYNGRALMPQRNHFAGVGMVN